MERNTYSVYQDMNKRTGGQLYIGVVGPVRTGKSTFIKRFIELCVLPNVLDVHETKRIRDELPQSSGGRTITTTEPKFIPKEAAQIVLEDNISMQVRLIDCVGYMADGAVGHMEEGQERIVKTPWDTSGIPFTKAAEIGTTKVIDDHATVGIVVTSDGTFGDLDRSAYLTAEEKTMEALSKTNKPYVLLLNSARPYSDETLLLSKELADKYKIDVLPVNCEQLKKEDIHHILEVLLMGFPLTSVEFYLPKWIEMLPLDNEIKASVVQAIQNFMNQKYTVKALKDDKVQLDCEYVQSVTLDSVNMATGIAKIFVSLKESNYYKMLSAIAGESIQNEYELIRLLKQLSQMKEEYTKVGVAMHQVRNTGYGIVLPEQAEIVLESPELIKHGNKYGVKIKAKSPSIHMIRANVETEIAPIVGTKEQADDLVSYMSQSAESENGVWETNIFGKTIAQLVQEGIQNKIALIGEESQLKLQESMQKIVNDTNGGMVCIII